MLILGIDPGVNGSLALFDKAEQRVTCHDMPDTTTGLQELVSGLPAVAFAVLEKPYYPKVIGIKNVAAIAEAYGKIKASLVWRGIPIREVRPAEWKAALNLSSNKAASREMAGLIFPDDAEQWARVKDDGRAEAALIAWYGLKWK
jgi:hypothetical protein